MNIIKHTLKRLPEDLKGDSVGTVKEIFRNCGVEFYKGSLNEVKEVLETNDYMSWETCEAEDAYNTAKNGIATVGISEDRIFIIISDTKSEEDEVLTNLASEDIIMLLDEDMSKNDLTGIQLFFNLASTTDENNRYSYQEIYYIRLMNIFEFSDIVASLIISLYNKVDKKFPSETKLQKAWKCSILLSMFKYDGSLWNDVAGSVVSLSEAENYFTTVLGFTVTEYNKLKTEILNQHTDTSTTDFVHLQYSLAARLAYKLNYDGFISNIETFCSDEKVSYLAGWLGDATLVENNKTSMGNDDYCSDLDAENIYRYIIQGKSSIDAIG